jgi:multicomponent Na+:H+ antiporter subunit B
MAAEMITIDDIALLTMLCFTAIAIMLLRHLFAVAALTGAFSLLSAGLLVALDAVDVAFTEAAVGAGISTVLMLGTLALTQRREHRPPRFSLAALLVVIATGGALIYATSDMPAYGDPNAPALKHVVPLYIEGSRSDIGVPNIVTSILASYRGYDTLGEVAVIFTAGIGVMFLLGLRREDEDDEGTIRRGPGSALDAPEPEGPKPEGPKPEGTKS